MKTPPDHESRNANIRAYILFGVLLALFPIQLGYKAVHKEYFEDKVVYYHGCQFTVVDKPYADYSEIEPRGEAGLHCVDQDKKSLEADAIDQLTPKQLTKLLQKHSQPNQ